MVALVGGGGFGCAVAPRSPQLYLETILQGWRGLGKNYSEGAGREEEFPFYPTLSWQHWRVMAMAWHRLLGVSGYWPTES